MENEHGLDLHTKFEQTTWILSAIATMLPGWCFLNVILLSVACFFVSPAASAAEKYALIIGIKGYPNFPKEEKLKFADEDSQRFRDFLQSPAGGEFKDKNIYHLKNENATRPAIFAAIRKLKNRTDGSDLVIVYFAGHGIVADNTIAYFMPFDADPQEPAALGIKSSEFIQKIKAEVDAKVQIFFIDACHSGSALNSEGTAMGERDLAGPLIKEVEAKLPEGRQTMGLLSASPYQNSWEDNTLKSALFSYYLLQGLKGDADNDTDRKVTVGELYRYVLDNVERVSQKKFELQTPVISPSYNAAMIIAIVSPDTSPVPVNPGSSPTPTPPKAATLRESTTPALTQQGPNGPTLAKTLKSVNVKKYGFSVLLPVELFPNASARFADSQVDRIESPHGCATASFKVIPTSLKTTYESYLALFPNRTDGKSVDYKVQKADWFVVSGSTWATGFYIKGVRRGDETIVMELEYTGSACNIPEILLTEISRKFDGTAK